MTDLVERKHRKGMLIFVDLLLIALSYLLAFVIRYEQIPDRNWDSFVSILPWIMVVSLFFLSIYETYAMNRKSFWDLVRSIFVSATFISFFTMSVSFLIREFALPRSVLLLAFFLMVILLSFWKYVFLFFSRTTGDSHLLVIASEEETDKFLSQMKHSFRRPSVYRIAPDSELRTIISNISKPRIDAVLISSSISEEMRAQIIYNAMRQNKTIYVIPSLYDLLLSKAIITSIDDTMVMGVKPFGLTYDERIIKRIFDIVVSVIAIVLTMPVMFIVAILIKLESFRDPVFYTQTRVGQDNKEFILYKFRSMVRDAEKNTGPVLAQKNDSRITKLGKWIRVTRLDELPQLVNVLKGDMSIVGPRPERDYFIKILSEQYEAYHYRNSVKPGLTGYAQIMGKYTTDAIDKLRFDLYYIRNYSIWLDVVIILRTIVVVLDRSKAEGEAEGPIVNKSGKTIHCK